MVCLCTRYLKMPLSGISGRILSSLKGGRGFDQRSIQHFVPLTSPWTAFHLHNGLKWKRWEFSLRKSHWIRMQSQQFMPLHHPLFHPHQRQVSHMHVFATFKTKSWKFMTFVWRNLMFMFGFFQWKEVHQHLKEVHTKGLSICCHQMKKNGVEVHPLKK